jgi:8-oxo-dGTP pyrophosphatase MutT (NUDIX family)
LAESSLNKLNAAETPSAPSDIFALAKARLALDLVETLFDEHGRPSQGDHRLNPQSLPKQSVRSAAVLIGLVAHEEDVSVILTKRASALKVHSGQIAFPGGKIEPTDKDPLAAALREAWEEIGLEAHHAEPIGYLEPYLTRTGFLVHPVVAKIIPPFELRINPGEVEDAFEVPLSFLMNADHHKLHKREEDGVARFFYAMSYGDRLIWGVTAGILRHLYERLYL